MKKIWMRGEKEMYKYLGILEAFTIKKKAEKKENIKQRVPQENDKATRNQSIKQKIYQRYKHLGCPFCKILGTILKVEEGKTSTNEPKNKKTNDDT